MLPSLKFSDFNRVRCAVGALAVGLLLSPVHGFGEAASAEQNLEPWERPIRVEDAKDIQLEAVTEFGYEDEEGRIVVDLLELDRAYLEVRLTTPDGRPVEGAKPEIVLEGSSQLYRDSEATGPDGVLTFEVSAGQMGLDSLYVRQGSARKDFLINVISLKAAGFPEPLRVEGGLGWELLMQARVSWEELKMKATFPEEIEAQAGKTVKISGFMMPLDPDIKQRHFLVTSNPPSCFFHVPGGPAGSVEVLAVEGIEVSWDPVVIEGRFEPQKTSEIGVVYRLTDARLVMP